MVSINAHSFKYLIDLLTEGWVDNGQKTIRFLATRK